MLLETKRFISYIHVITLSELIEFFLIKSQLLQMIYIKMMSENA